MFSTLFNLWNIQTPEFTQKVATERKSKMPVGRSIAGFFVLEF